MLAVTSSKVSRHHSQCNAREPYITPHYPVRPRVKHVAGRLGQGTGIIIPIALLPKTDESSDGVEQ